MSLIETRIQNLLSNANLDKYEYRASRYGALNVFQKQTNDSDGIISAEMIEKARESIGKTIQSVVIEEDKDLVIGNQRNLVIEDSENTSHFVTISFATYAWGFTIVPSLFMNNEVDIQTDFDKKMKKYLYKFASELDQAALAKLAAEKTQVISNPLLYDKTGNVINAKWTERENLLGDLNIIMEANDYYGALDVVGDPGLESIVKKLQQQGTYNDVNKGNEYGDKTFFYTNGLGSNGDKYANGYAINEGSLGMLTRFERECVLGTVARTGHEWDIITLPFIGVPCGSYYYESVGDYSGIAGEASADMDRVKKQHYGFAVDVAFVTNYNSDKTKKAQPILAFNVSKENAAYGKPVQIVSPIPE